MNRCGTVRGYFDHRIAGTPTCVDCRSAKRLYQLEKASAQGLCSMPGCEQTVKARELCGTHLSRLHRHGTPEAEGPSRALVFWQQVVLGPRVDHMPDACWLWTGNRGKRYGKFGSDSTLVHRFAYEDMTGPIPDDLTIDHLCRVTLCVNPSHLEPVPRGVNVTRQWQHYRAERQYA